MVVKSMRGRWRAGECGGGVGEGDGEEERVVEGMTVWLRGGEGGRWWWRGGEGGGREERLVDGRREWWRGREDGGGEERVVEGMRRW